MTLNITFSVVSNKEVAEYIEVTEHNEAHITEATTDNTSGQGRTMNISMSLVDTCTLSKSSKRA